jgi:iron(III) transport system permease protein
VILPLLVPSFLWAIGWAAVAARLGSSVSETLSGLAGCLLVLSAQGIPLVLFMTYAATVALSGSQVDAARLAGGERVVLRAVGRFVAIPALLAAGLGGVLTLSDPGPGQIFGYATAASEILTSFAARYDFALAGRQCLALTACVVILALPLILAAAPRLASAVLARQVRAAQRSRHRAAACVIVTLLGVVAVLGTIIPLVGGEAFVRAWSELARTAGNTVSYALGAGIIATIFGLFLALCAGRSDRLRTVCLGLALGCLALPPALTALGIVQLAMMAPAWADLLVRSRFTVCAALGVRFFPVAVVLGARAWGMTSASWGLAASVHGVPLRTYFRRVLFPLLRPVAGVSVVLVALLATADITTVLFVHPPGEQTLPLAIVTVMANAPESLVASLCVVYVTAAMGVLTVAWALAGGRHV